MRQSLTTARLDCEPLVANHAPLVFSELCNDDLYRFIPQEPPASVEVLTARFERLEREPYSPDGTELWLNWVMHDRDTGAYVGTLEASVVHGQSATIAYFVFVQYQRLGYATEGVAALIDLLVDVYQLQVVVAEIDTRNTASIALVKALGFACVGRVEEADFFNGAASDEYRFELRSAG